MSKCNSTGVSARAGGAGVTARGALLPPSRAKCGRSHLPGAVRFYKLPGSQRHRNFCDLLICSS